MSSSSSFSSPFASSSCSFLGSTVTGTGCARNAILATAAFLIPSCRGWEVTRYGRVWDEILVTADGFGAAVSCGRSAHSHRDAACLGPGVREGGGGSANRGPGSCMVPRRGVQLSSPPMHSSQARPLIQAKKHRDGARPRPHPRITVDVFVETLAQNRTAVPPPRPHQTDGDDAEDNDNDVLLACWYSEWDCWYYHCTHAVPQVRCFFLFRRFGLMFTVVVCIDSCHSMPTSVGCVNSQPEHGFNEKWRSARMGIMITILFAEGQGGGNSHHREPQEGGREGRPIPQGTGGGGA